MDRACLERLRGDLHEANYTVTEVRRILGSTADAARQRGIFAPAHLALSRAGREPIVTLIRLLLLGDVISRAGADRAFPALGSAGLLELGIVQPRDGGLRAVLALNPIELPDPRADDPRTRSHWWIISDLDDHLRRGPARTDHVMGVGGATRTLIAQAPMAPPAEGGAALELGTGCGIVAMLLARAGWARVLATDLSPRALRFARANAVLAGLDARIEFREGDLFEPVGGRTATSTRSTGSPERFDLILSNPPFVITPRVGDLDPRYEYRDAGLRGDELVRAVVTGALPHLAPRGALLCLANWESRWGDDGLARVTRWVEAAAPDGSLGLWAIERERLDPAAYAEVWIRDGGHRPGDPAFDEVMRVWLDDLAERRVVSIGLGSIRIVRRAEPAPRSLVVRTEAVEGSYAEGSGALLQRVCELAMTVETWSDAEILRTRWLRADAVVEHRSYTPGQESPRAIRLQIDRPFERAVSADPLLAGAVGACDGELALGQLAGALAALFDVDEADVCSALVEGVRELCWLGMLAPVGALD